MSETTPNSAKITDKMTDLIPLSTNDQTTIKGGISCEEKRRRIRR
jgi:hypothetical protein